MVELQFQKNMYLHYEVTELYKKYRNLHTYICRKFQRKLSFFLFSYLHNLSKFDIKCHKYEKRINNVRPNIITYQLLPKPIGFANFTCNLNFRNYILRFQIKSYCMNRDRIGQNFHQSYGYCKPYSYHDFPENNLLKFFRKICNQFWSERNIIFLIYTYTYSI